MAILLFLLPLLAACGKSEKEGAQIQWIEGTAPPDFLTQAAPTLTAGEPTIAPTLTPESQPTTDPAVQPTQEPAAPTAAATSGPSGAEIRLSADQLEQYKPDELGMIPVLEYHVFTIHPENEAQFIRPIEKFKTDLQWLYDHDFYVVKLHDMVDDAISAPAGKHPVVLTFDDSTAGQFRYLFAADGSATIDPNSAVGVMEAFYAAHPDFGRGGFFALLPTDNFCFSWQGENTEDDQLGHCGEKVTFLLDNGYEVGNHTLTHRNLTDISDDDFLKELGGAFETQATLDTRAFPDILALPFGQYPDKDKHPQQREWLREGFTYNGTDYRIIAALMVGSEPVVSPVSTEWDPLFINRIQVDDRPDYGYTGYWLPAFADNPGALYTSDGNPTTITVPNDLPIDLDGTLDPDRIDQDGKELIRY